MILVLLIGLVLIAVSFGLFARTLLMPRLRAAESLRRIDVYGFSGAAPDAAARQGKLPKLHLREGIDSLAGKLGELLSGRVKSMSEENLRKILQGAGFYTVQPRRFVGYQALGTLAMGALFAWFVLAGNANPLLGIIAVVTALLCGWSLPLTFVKRRARMRGERIDLDMPELIDMLVATVEAGIAFGSSLQMAAKRFRGPLGEELRLTLQEQSMGLGLNQALDNMLRRQNTPSVRAFVRSLIQGERLGVSIGQNLRNLSHEMRTIRRQLAEERAQKAPVKLVFPVVLLIFPALFVDHTRPGRPSNARDLPVSVHAEDHSNGHDPEQSGVSEQSNVSGMRKMVLVAPNGHVVCDTCHVADKPHTRLRGIMGWKSIRRGEGLCCGRPSPSTPCSFVSPSTPSFSTRR